MLKIIRLNGVVLEVIEMEKVNAGLLRMAIAVAHLWQIAEILLSFKHIRMHEQFSIIICLLGGM